MNRVPILMYHSVTDRPNAETRPLAVRPGDFAEQLAYLDGNGFTPMTFASLIAAVNGTGATLPARPVVLTFDDGYADFHTEAMPILDRFGFPATLFLTTGWVADAGGEAAGRPLDHMVSWSQAREAAAQGHEIAGHSHSHPQLDQLPDAELRQELRRGKAVLEDRLGLPVTTMAYPYGYSSARVRREARRAGFWAACAVANDMADLPAPDMLAVPRLTVSRTTGPGRFARAVEGRALPLVYLRERALTRGYAVVRRGRYGIARFARRA